MAAAARCCALVFLSTPSVRRATRRIFGTFGEQIFLSTPSVRRATFRSASCRATSSISIHALREEGDPATSASPCSSKKFLSTPSVRRATACSWACIVDAANFYPRPP